MSISFLCVNIYRERNSIEIDVFDFGHFPGSAFIILRFEYISVLIDLDSKIILSKGINCTGNEEGCQYDLSHFSDIYWCQRIYMRQQPELIRQLSAVTLVVQR